MNIATPTRPIGAERKKDRVEEEIRKLLTECARSEKRALFYHEKRVGEELAGVEVRVNSEAEKEKEAKRTSQEEDVTARWVWGAGSPMARQLISQQEVPFEVWESVRSDSGFWHQPAHVGSLPFGILSQEKWLRRITEVEFVAGSEWGALVRIKVGVASGLSTFAFKRSEIKDDRDVEIGGISIRKSRQEVTVEGPPEALSKLKVMRRVNRRKFGEGSEKWTVEIEHGQAFPQLKEEESGEVPQLVHFRKGEELRDGVLIQMTAKTPEARDAQWREVRKQLERSEWAAGKVIRESASWVAVGGGDEVVEHLQRWKQEGKLSSDIGYRRWTVETRGQQVTVSVTAGAIDGFSKREWADVTAHATTRVGEDEATAVLKAFGVQVRDMKVSTEVSQAEVRRKFVFRAARNAITQYFGRNLVTTDADTGERIRIVIADYENAGWKGSVQKGEESGGVKGGGQKPKEKEDAKRGVEKGRSNERKPTEEAAAAAQSGAARKRKSAAETVDTSNSTGPAEKESPLEKKKGRRCAAAAADASMSELESSDEENQDGESGESSDDDMQEDSEGELSPGGPAAWKSGQTVAAVPREEGAEELLTLIKRKRSGGWIAQKRGDSKRVVVRHQECGKGQRQWVIETWAEEGKKPEGKCRYISSKKKEAGKEVSEEVKSREKAIEEARQMVTLGAEGQESTYSLNGTRKCGSAELQHTTTRENGTGRDVGERAAGRRSQDAKPRGRKEGAKEEKGEGGPGRRPSEDEQEEE